MKETLKLLPFIAILAIGSAANAETAEKTDTAKHSIETSITADFIDTNGKKIGTATFTEEKNGTAILINADIPEGEHSMHIHEKGKCETPDFASAGDHYNPENKTDDSYAGNLTSLNVGENGHIEEKLFSDKIHLTGENALKEGAIVIHASSSTDRIACAVIK